MVFYGPFCRMTQVLGKNSIQSSFLPADEKKPLIEFDLIWLEKTVYDSKILTTHN